MHRRFFLNVLLSMIVVMPTFAQLDQEEEMASLVEIGQFGLVVDIESAGTLAADPALAGSSVRSRLAERLESMSGERLSPDPIERTDPYLYVHINVMDVGDGLVPFAVNASFIQRAQLASGGQRMMSITWESGSVGLVSYDRLPAIVEAAEVLVREFAEDRVAAGGGS